MPKKKATILVVEDDAILVKVLSKTIEERGYKVLMAENGKVGLKLALKNHPDLILMDLNMPIMDGFEMLEELRKDKWGQNAYVIILTNQTPSDDLYTEANHMPYRSEYLMKSEYDIDQVLEIIKNRLKEQQKKK